MGERFSTIGMQRNVRHWTYSTVVENLMPGDVRDQNIERREVIAIPNSERQLESSQRVYGCK
jgi:hypothetical protein